MKKIFIKIRSTIKFLILIIILMALIVGIFAFVYKPIYKVTLGDEVVGYCAQKSKLQAEIAEFVEKGNEDNKNLAFVEVDNMPTYSLCLLKRGITTNDDEIFEKVKQTGTAYYRYYTILEDNEEKYYVPNFEMAESVVNKLKEKDSNNIDNIQILEKYETNLQNFATEEEAVAGFIMPEVNDKDSINRYINKIVIECLYGDSNYAYDLIYDECKVNKFKENKQEFINYINNNKDKLYNMNISEINVGETDDEFDIKYSFKDVDGNIYYLYVVEAEDFYFSIK